MSDLPAPDGPIIDPFASDKFAREACAECNDAQKAERWFLVPGWEKARCRMHRNSVRT